MRSHATGVLSGKTTVHLISSTMLSPNGGQTATSVRSVTRSPSRVGQLLDQIVLATRIPAPDSCQLRDQGDLRRIFAMSFAHGAGQGRWCQFRESGDVVHLHLVAVPDSSHRARPGPPACQGIQRRVGITPDSA